MQLFSIRSNQDRGTSFSHAETVEIAASAFLDFETVNKRISCMLFLWLLFLFAKWSMQLARSCRKIHCLSSFAYKTSVN